MQENRTEGPQMTDLYCPELEHDNCGIGAVVNLKGERSHKTVDDALTIVERLEHRAGKDALGQTGDGVGILLQLPHDYFLKHVTEIKLPEDGSFAVGMFFFSQDELKRNQAKKIFEMVLKKEGLHFLGWRKVPTFDEVLSTQALECRPAIYQAFIEKPRRVEMGLPFDRKLYVVRRIFEKANSETYVCSLSSRTIVYKGMFLVGQLRTFYADLQDPDFRSAIALVHSRFSTNTFPSWERAHPNRFMVHNGEINTIRGNVNKMLSREETMHGDVLGDDVYKVLPVVDHWTSDSAMLDNTLEFLLMSGMDLPKAVMICIPEPWNNDRNMAQNRKDFYRYYATIMEPWDGPASILFTDGDIMGAVLDRNGLRPSRYYVTTDGYLILSSEVGVLDLPPESILRKERLRPGKMLLVDTRQGRIISDEEIKNYYAAQAPYGEWLEEQLLELSDLPIPNKKTVTYKKEELEQLQQVYGYSYEDVNDYLRPMALDGSEPVAAMGTDTPLALLSPHPQPLFNYFKQLFAQVTNPPIDAIREEIITSTYVYLGADGNLLQDHAENCKSLAVRNPILTNTDLLKIKYMDVEGFQVAVIPIIYYRNMSLEEAIDELFLKADRAVRDGANILILSDRELDEFHKPIPSLLAVSALQQHLVRTKKRMSLSVILESAEPREVHHCATLLGYGASAVNPYLALESIRQLIDDDLLDKDYYAAANDYTNGLLHGIVKIASKMGISTIQSYMGSQIFEAVGIGQDVIQKYFTNTVSRIGGLNLQDIEQDVDRRFRRAFDPLGLPVSQVLGSSGQHKARSGKEEHLYNPQTIYMLQSAVRNNRYDQFKTYSRMITEELGPSHIRSLLDFRFADTPIPLEQVEPVESIVKRFKVGAMSFGSLSKEAHETLAIAMNRLGGKSNTGEGGEDPSRFHPDANGDSRNSAIKQVASGRFGVTSEYLVSAKEIQIKMAQGAKPGEGGQLPGNKVYPEVAHTRHSTPGVGLISPPPHHDIYSIEDLAQLIYDLKSANDQADINVKLVSEAGVGTIASGVAKAGAQVILVSGYDGGTGAAPRNSIQHAGLPWELGIAEAHQTLLKSGLRRRVRLEADSKLMCGRDVVIAALLGAEEFGFATGPLVSMGCVMMRVCNQDVCPVGIATQNPELRKRFAGKPEHVMHYMQFMAQEVREYMAQLGIRTMDELVGRTDLLRVKEDLPVPHAGKVQLEALLAAGGDNVHFEPSEVYDFKLSSTKDETVLYRQLKDKLARKEPAALSLHVTNTDRAFGTMFGSRITRLYGEHGLPDDLYRIHCHGSGGQSFGAFIPRGLTLELEGDCNDYLGKGLSGGTLVIYPPAQRVFQAEDNIIIGNVALYGATSGKAFINGVAGERFCVRNSGATAVVEGVGDHGLEYMTGGCVVILGPTGNNLAAGMSGGVAYVLDEKNDLYARLNRELVSLELVKRSDDVHELQELLRQHVAATGSPRGQEILEQFEQYLPKFKKIVPHDYKRMHDMINEYKSKGLSYEQAEIVAFNQMKGEGSHGKEHRFLRI
ncbi:MAG: glutamate synthase large subunit [Peptococcaceae bacterium]